MIQEASWYARYNIPHREKKEEKKPHVHQKYNMYK